MAGPLILIVSDSRYGNEKPGNALRLEKTLVTTKQVIRIFLLGDAVVMAKKKGNKLRPDITIWVKMN